jgi:hypothetical protein
VNTIIDPLPGNLLLVVAPRAAGAIMLDLIARLACRGSLRLLDGGNRFDLHGCNLAIARNLRQRSADLPLVLERIQLARAFTCYQMVTLLKETPSHATPTLVLDMLSTFYDENVSTTESQRLLQACISTLQRLNRLAPVAISAQPGPDGARPELLLALQSATEQFWTLEPHTPSPPLRLL